MDRAARRLQRSHTALTFGQCPVHSVGGMNKNTTRIALSLIATPVLLGTLAACSSGGDATSADAPEVADSQAPDETQAPAETAAPESSAAPSDDSSQGQAASGVDYTAAITAAQDEVGSGSFAVSLDLDDDGDDRFDIDPPMSLRLAVLA